MPLEQFPFFDPVKVDTYTIKRSFMYYLCERNPSNHLEKKDPEQGTSASSLVAPTQPPKDDVVSDDFFAKIPDGIYMFIQNHQGEWLLKKLVNHSSGHHFAANLIYGTLPDVCKETRPILKTEDYDETSHEKLYPYVRAAGEICVHQGHIMFWSLKSGSYKTREADFANVGLPDCVFLKYSKLEALYQNQAIQALYDKNGCFKEADGAKLSEKAAQGLISLRKFLEQNIHVPAFKNLVANIERVIQPFAAGQSFTPQASPKLKRERQAQDDLQRHTKKPTMQSQQQSAGAVKRVSNCKAL